MISEITNIQVKPIDNKWLNFMFILHPYQPGYKDLIFTVTK